MQRHYTLLNATETRTVISHLFEETGRIWRAGKVEQKTFALYTLDFEKNSMYVIYYNGTYTQTRIHPTFIEKEVLRRAGKTTAKKTMPDLTDIVPNMSTMDRMKAAKKYDYCIDLSDWIALAQRCLKAKKAIYANLPVDITEAAEKLQAIDKYFSCLFPEGGELSVTIAYSNKIIFTVKRKSEFIFSFTGIVDSSGGVIERGVMRIILSDPRASFVRHALETLARTDIKWLSHYEVSQGYDSFSVTIARKTTLDEVTEFMQTELGKLVNTWYVKSLEG